MVFELYCVVVLLCKIFMCLMVVEGMVFKLIDIEFLLVVLFKLRMVLEWNLCLLSSISVWFGVSFFKEVGLMCLVLFMSDGW